MKFEYLIFDALIFLLSTCSVFLYKGAKLPQLKAAALATLIMAVPYLVWDALVIGQWWEFNTNYILGPRLAGLPVEEWLFFFVVPWAILILWQNLPLLGSSKKIQQGWLLWGVLAVVSLWLATQSWYGLVVGCLYFTALVVVREKLTQSYWLTITMLVLAATTIFNMYLTARPVVIYQDSAISGLKVGTIPVEDFYYGLVLLLGVTYAYEQFKQDA